MKSDIQNLHKRIYEHTKKRALSFFGKPNKLLKKYHKDQIKYARRNHEQSNMSNLLSSIRKSNIIYLGDFHTFDQNSKNLERIIKTQIKGHNEFILGLEMVYGHHQKFIDAFLNNDLTELEFLESINYHESWRFPWNHYKILFELAKQTQFKIFALNSEGDLKHRDEFASNRLISLVQEFPNASILVLFGELHIVPDKIPKKVEKRAKNLGLENFYYTIIHQNLDEVYWKMKNMVEEETIVRFQGNEFSLQSSPPWIKYESLIYWFENLCEDPDFDIHEYLIETGVKTFSSNINFNFLFICNEIFRFFKIPPIPKSEIEDFNLYDHSKLKFVNNKIGELKSKSLFNFYHYLLTTGQSFKIPYRREYYCASYSINRLAYLVGNHIFNLTHLKKENFLEDGLISNSHQKKFLDLLQLAMISYFSSKIINPHRKCELYQDICIKIKMKETSSDDRNYLKKAITIIDSKTPLKNIFFRNQLKTYYEVTKIVGHFLSEILYEQIIIEESKKSIGTLYDLLFSVQLTEEGFQTLKKEILSDVNYKKKRKRFF